MKSFLQNILLPILGGLSVLNLFIFFESGDTSDGIRSLILIFIFSVNLIVEKLDNIKKENKND